MSAPFYSSGSFSNVPNEEEKSYFREDFIPPEFSIINFFINKKKREENAASAKLDDDIESDDDDDSSSYSNRDEIVDNYLEE